MSFHFKIVPLLREEYVIFFCGGGGAVSVPDASLPHTRVGEEGGTGGLEAQPLGLLLGLFPAQGRGQVNRGGRPTRRAVWGIWFVIG